MRNSTKGWLKAAVVTFGIVDCVGIYVAQHRLAQPVPADMGDDLAYALPVEPGVFRPDQGMPSQGPVRAAPPSAAKPAAARLAVAAPVAAPAPARIEPTANVRPAAPAPHFALAAPTVAPLHHVAAAPVPGSVRIARLDPAAPAAHPARLAAPHSPAARSAPHGSSLHLAEAAPARDHTRLFADAFSSGFANVALDAPITRQLEDSPPQSAFAEDGSTPDVQLAHNGGIAPVVSGGAEPDSTVSDLPDTGMTVALPDSDKL